MKYRKLGNTGLKVSEIGLGSWLTYGTAAEQKAADACVAKAFECGISFFDTAIAYNRGEGEQAVCAAPGTDYIDVYFCHRFDNEPPWKQRSAHSTI